jgi:hypothetical protein
MQVARLYVIPAVRFDRKEIHDLPVARHLDGQQVSRPLFFDTGGFDGRQARLRCQIDQLKAKQVTLSKTSPGYRQLQRELDLCWAAYDRRNQALAHLAANFLLLLAGLYGCQVIAGEWLAMLKSVGRGRDAQGRWRNWRNNTTLRSAITTVLAYKCKLAGFRLRFEHPRGTSHTCPRCGQPARTFKSPEHAEVSDWGAWPWPFWLKPLPRLLLPSPSTVSASQILNSSRSRIAGPARRGRFRRPAVVCCASPRPVRRGGPSPLSSGGQAR